MSSKSTKADTAKSTKNTVEADMFNTRGTEATKREPASDKLAKDIEMNKIVTR